MSGLTDRLWERFGKLAVDEVPSEVAAVAGHSILDWFGCALAGSREPLSAILRAELSFQAGHCTLIGTEQRADRYRAALINGAAGHALDFDDSSAFMGGHPSAPLVPALLALCEAEGRTGADLLAAYVVGSEVQARIGAGIGPEHYAKGWHVTSTVGVFGAAAGCSWLLGLEADRFGAALGLAASGSAGVKANFGTMAKPLHPGAAAERGLLAALLAARGYTASPEAIDGNQGLFQAAGSGPADEGRLGRWADGWATPRTLFKFHAACHFTHAGIEATSSLLRQGLEVGEIEQITLTVNPSILDVCGITSPTTGLQAKFSLRGTQALLVHGFDGIDGFGDEPVNRPEVQAFFDRVAIETDPSMPATQTSVVIRADHGEFRAHHDIAQPVSDPEVQGARLLAKFAHLAQPVIGQQNAENLAARLNPFDKTTEVKKLLLLTPP